MYPVSWLMVSPRAFSLRTWLLKGAVSIPSRGVSRDAATRGLASIRDRVAAVHGPVRLLASILQVLLVAAVMPQPGAAAGRTARPLKPAPPVITELSEAIAILLNIESQYRVG